MRGFLHGGGASFGGANWSLDRYAALRTSYTLLDSSSAFEAAGGFQDGCVRSCYKFLDSQVNYDPKEVNLLLRALQDNDCDVRKKFFKEVRSNRRRRDEAIEAKSVGKVFITPDEYHLLQHKVTMARIKKLLTDKRLYIRDAFGAFDCDKDGLLSVGELYGGLEWLGVKLNQNAIKELFEQMDKDKDGFINMEDFKVGVLGEDGEEEEIDGMGEGLVGGVGGISITPGKDLDKKNSGIDPKDIEVPGNILGNIKIKAKNCTKFSQVWKSAGSMSRQKASVWKPVLEGADRLFRQNKELVCVGHYCGYNFDNPNKVRPSERTSAERSERGHENKNLRTPRRGHHLMK